MKRNVIGATIVAALLAGVLLAAAPTSNTRHLLNTRGRYDLLDAQDATAAAANRTVTQKVAGFARLLTSVTLTDANSSVTAVTATCTGSIDRGSTYGSVTSRAIAAGVGTTSAYYDSIAVSGTATYVLVYDVWGYDSFRCVYAATGTVTSADLFDVQWKLAVGK